MIDSKAGLSLEQAMLVKLHAEPEVTNSEKQERGRQIEQVAKAGGEQHRAALDYLDQQFNQQLVAQKMLADNEHSSAASKPNDLAGAIAGAESQSEREAKALADSAEHNAHLHSNDANTQSATQHTASNAVAEALAGLEGQSDKEADKLSKAEEQIAQNTNINKVPTGNGVYTDEHGNTVIIPGEANFGDSSLDRNIDEGFQHPVWQDPPKVPYPDGFDVRSVYDGGLDANALLTQLALQLSSAMKDAVERRIEANEELMSITNTLQLEVIEMKTEDQIEQLEKADQAAKAGNCISIMVSIGVMLLSIALTIVSGGSAASLIALGVAAVFFVIDMSMTAAGETPLSAMMMEPIMTHVIMPVIQAIGNIIADLLESFGVDETTAQLVGMIMGAIFVAAAIIAMVIFAKNSSALTGFMSKMSGKMMGAFAKITPDFVKNAAAGFSRQATGVMTKLHARMGTIAATETKEEAVKRFMEEGAERITTGMIFMTGVGGLAGSAAGIVSADAHKDYTLTQAQLEQVMHLMLTSNDDLQKLIETLRGIYEKVNDVINAALESEKGQTETAKTILNNISVGV